MDVRTRRSVDLPVYTSPEAVVSDLTPGYPVFCVRPHEIKAVARRFLDGFPGDVLYAVKCNPEPHMLGALSEAGIRHFDTASIAEVAKVGELFPDATSYFMHPVKSRAAILSAHKVYGVRYFVVDHVSELEKIASIIPPGLDTVIVVRLEVHYDGAVYELSSKFGAPLDEAVVLARDVLERGYNYGLSFHVGSQCLDAGGFELGLDLVRQALAGIDSAPCCVDVGGGFPAHYVNSQGAALETYFAAIKYGLASLSLPPDCQVMCEPGRGLCADGESLITQVHLRKSDALYLNDGMYGSFIEEKLGLQLPVRTVASRQFSAQQREFTLYGPTCDSLDVFPMKITLPIDIAEGDWIEFGCIGAYGVACRTRFNGFFADTFVAVENSFGQSL